MVEVLAMDILTLAAVADRLADEVFCDLGRGIPARDGGSEAVVLERAVFEEEFELSLCMCDEFRVRVSGSSSGKAFR